MAIWCFGPEMSLLRGAVSMGVAEQSCPHPVGSHAKLLGAGYQDQAGGTCLPCTQALLHPEWEPVFRVRWGDWVGCPKWRQEGKSHRTSLLLTAQWGRAGFPSGCNWGCQECPWGPQEVLSHLWEGTRGRDRGPGALQSSASGSELGQKAEHGPSSILWEE